MQYKKKQEILPDGELTIAPLRRRFLAILIDIAMLIMVVIGILMLMQALGYDIKKLEFKGFAHVEVESEKVSKPVLTIIKFFMPTLIILYFTLTTYFFNGQTLGKKLLKIRAVSLYEEHLGIWHCLERSLGYAASSLELGLGFIQGAWNQNRMMLHDKIAGTIVIYTGKRK